LIGGLVLAFHKTTKTVSTIPSTSPTKTIATKPATQTQPTTNTTASNTPLTDSSKPAPTSNADTNAKLVTPYGTFVSNHHPTLSGSPGPSEESVCNTTPGATCYIEF